MTGLIPHNFAVGPVTPLDKAFNTYLARLPLPKADLTAEGIFPPEIEKLIASRRAHPSYLREERAIENFFKALAVGDLVALVRKFGSDSYWALPKEGWSDMIKATFFLDGHKVIGPHDRHWGEAAGQRPFVETARLESWLDKQSLQAGSITVASDRFGVSTSDADVPNDRRKRRKWATEQERVKAVFTEVFGSRVPLRAELPDADLINRVARHFDKKRAEALQRGETAARGAPSLDTILRAAGRRK